MKLKILRNAMLNFRNIGVLLILLGIASAEDVKVLTAAIPNGEFLSYLAGLSVYTGFVAQNLLSKEYHEKFNKKEKRKQIKNLDNMCSKLLSEARKHLNSSYMKKLKRVMDDKNEILSSFLKGEQGYLKERIVEQTLNLVLSYVKLMINYCKRSKELSQIDVGDIANRINTNNRKLSFLKDPYAAEDLKKVIEMDEKIVVRLKEEKHDLERISTKLDYMESMVNMFKHQVLSSIESQDMVEKLETAVNEASALDSVLEERRRSNRIRI